MLYGKDAEHKDEGVNGHSVTYLDAIFERYAHSVLKKMLTLCIDADKSMKWELLTEDSFRFKNIEYIQYNEKGANLGWHCDMGSLVTIVLMLSDADEYEGGNFQCRKLQTLSDGQFVEHEAQDVPLDAGDIVVFASDKCNHRVTDLVSGSRKVLVMELIFW